MIEELILSSVRGFPLLTGSGPSASGGQTCGGQGNPTVQARLESIGVGHDHRACALQSQINHGPRHGMGASANM